MSKQAPHRLFAALILIGGLFLLGVLIYEFKQNLQLLNNSERLLRDSVQRSLDHHIADIRKHYPKNYEQLEDQWQTLKPDFYWFSKNQQRFPFTFKGDTDNNDVSRWQKQIQRYNTALTNTPLDKTKENTQIQDSYLENRIAIVQRFGHALQDQDEPELELALSEFLEHKLAYRLSQRQEIISSLQLISADHQHRFSPTLSKAILIDGWQTQDGKVTSAYQRLLQDNSSLGLAEYQLAFDHLLTLAEALNFDPEPIRQSLALSTKPFTPELPTSEGLWLWQSWLIYGKSGEQNLLVPLDLPQLASGIAQRFIAMGLLQPGDSLSFKPNPGLSPYSQLNIELQLHSLQRQHDQQVLFFIVKLILLFCLSALALYALRSLQQHAQRERKYLNLREEFLGMVSHELKTPLASIRLMAETLHLRLEKKMAAKDYPTRIVNESSKMHDMVENLLSLQRLKSGELHLECAALPLKTFIEKCLAEISSYTTKPIDMQLTMSEQQQLCVDETLFTLVIKNLMINASKYCQHERVNLHITCDSQDHYVTITLRDNGIGINAEYWQAVFTDFYRLKALKSESGSGLGLPLCRRIMLAHQGQITIQSSGEQGTTWHLQFPKNAPNTNGAVIHD